MKRLLIISSILMAIVTLNINFVTPNLKEAKNQQQTVASDTTAIDSSVVKFEDKPKDEIRYFGRGSFEEPIMIEKQAEKKKIVKSKRSKVASK